MNLSVIKAAKEEIEKEHTACSKKLGGFPKGEMGLTPDSVKKSEEYKIAKRNYEIAHKKLRAFNSKLTSKQQRDLRKLKMA